MSRKAKKISIQVLFGNRVRNLRLAQVMTQLDLAVNCDLEVTTISRIENGRTNVTLATIELIAMGLERPISDLMDINNEF